MFPVFPAGCTLNDSDSFSDGGAFDNCSKIAVVPEATYRGLAYETARLKLAQIRIEGRQSRQRAYGSLAQISAEAIGCDRVSVFSMLADSDALTTDCTYVSKTKQCAPGGQIEGAQALIEIMRNRRVAVFEELTSQNLGRFAETYLAPNAVISLLCAPVLREGRCTGLLTFESCAKGRSFGQEQLAFASSAADLLALILEQAARVELEAALHANSELKHDTLKMQALARLSRVVAHDINGLLTVVGVVATELALAPDGGTLAWADDLRKVVEMGRRLTESLMTFSADRPPLQDSVDLNAIVNEMLPVFRNLFTGKRTLNIASQLREARVFADVLSVQQVLLNLVTNARDAIGEVGTVTVRIREPQSEDALRVGAIVLEVEDDGVGMDEETQLRAAEPYFSTKAVGHGLGLSTVFGIAQRYGGGVRLSSSLGKGTRIAVALQRR